MTGHNTVHLIAARRLAYRHLARIGGRLAYRRTGVAPCVLHFNGGAKARLHAVAAQTRAVWVAVAPPAGQGVRDPSPEGLWTNMSLAELGAKSEHGGVS